MFDFIPMITEAEMALSGTIPSSTQTSSTHHVSQYSDSTNFSGGQICSNEVLDEVQQQDNRGIVDCGNDNSQLTNLNEIDQLDAKMTGEGSEIGLNDDEINLFDQVASYESKSNIDEEKETIRDTNVETTDNGM
jgi:hypothetical protein